MKIDIWSDFACPFCYMGMAMLANLLKEPEVAAALGRPAPEEGPAVTEKAYELDPDAPKVPAETMEEHFCSTHGVTPEEARAQMARITKMASRVGLDYHLDRVKVCSTFDAHRLMKMAAESLNSSRLLELSLALFKASFTDGLLLSDPGVLADVAASRGLDRGEVEAMLASDRYADEVRADEKEAEVIDPEYVPYLRFSSGKVLQGVLSPGVLRKAIMGV